MVLKTFSVPVRHAMPCDEGRNPQSAYLPMLVFKEKPAKDRVTIMGSTSVLEKGSAKEILRLEGLLPISRLA